MCVCVCRHQRINFASRQPSIRTQTGLSKQRGPSFGGLRLYQTSIEKATRQHSVTAPLPSTRCCWNGRMKILSATSLMDRKPDTLPCIDVNAHNGAVLLDLMDGQGLKLLSRPNTVALSFWYRICICNK